MLLTRLTLLLILSGTSILSAQTKWMGERITQSKIYLDPTEIQMSVSGTGLLSENPLERQYLPFAVGVDQSIFSKQVDKEKAWEIVGEMGVFTQFEWKQVNGITQRNMINVDYKIAFSYVRKINKLSTYRIRGFHVSSHLGDDYIFRNEIIKSTPNKVNYEQMEFTFFRKLENSNTRLMAGVGSVIRPDAIRLPFSYIIGIEGLNHPFNDRWGLTSGVIIKGFQETKFNLNIKAATGISYQAPSKLNPIRIVIEYYTGHLPYSQLEKQKIQWLGLGLYFDI